MDDQPAVPGRVGGIETQDRYRSPRGKRGTHPPYGLGLDQRRVGERDGDIVEAAGDGCPRRQNRVRGAAPLGLGENIGIGGEAPHFRHDVAAARADDHRQCVAGGRPVGARYRVRQHGAAGEPVQYFGNGGFHPRPLPGRQHERKAGSVTAGSVPAISFTA